MQDKIKSKGLRLPPISASLAGLFKKKEISEEDYKKHLEEKYLK